MDKAIEIVNTLLREYRTIMRDHPSSGEVMGAYDSGRISGMIHVIERLEKYRNATK